MYIKLPCLIIMLLITILCNAQTYVFDYVLEYRFENKTTKKFNTHYKFISTKDDTFTFTVWPSGGDKLFMKLSTADGKSYYSTMPKDDFFVEAISLKCPGMRDEKNNHGDKPGDFNIQTLSDTLINTVAYKHVRFTPLNQRKFAKGDTAICDYIFEDPLNLKKTFADPYSLTRRSIANGYNMPSGFIKEYYTTDRKGAINEYLTLVQYAAVKKIIIIDLSCK